MLEALEKMFEGRAPARPKKAAAGLEIGLDIDDFDELIEDIDEELDHDWIGATIGLEYTNAKGEMSRRFVTIKSFKVSGTGDYSMACYCFSSRRAKHFRLDRISALFDEDGEIVELDTLWDQAEEEAGEFKQPQKRKPRKSRKIIELVRDELTVLAALGGIDGDFCSDEREIALGMAEHLAAVSGVGYTDLRRAEVEGFLARLHPHGDLVSESVRNIIGKGEAAQKDFFWYARELIDADRVQDSREVEFLMDLSAWMAEM